MPLDFPSTLYPDKVVATHRRVQARAESPFSLKEQVFDWGTSRWEISLTFADLGTDDVATLGAWLDSLGGVMGTFYFDLTLWVPGLVPMPGVRTFRLKEPLDSWESERALVWGGFKLDAIEAV